MAASKVLAIVLVSLLSPFVTASGSSFNEDIDITWGDGRAKTTNRGKVLSLSLDPSSGSGFESKHEFLYGKFDIKLKLVPGNSAGIVTTFYLRSKGSTWDELDFEFLGNSSGEPYIVHTNVYIQGHGNREQQFYLWFDPTAKFHTYSVLWNPGHVVFSVDRKPIRVFRNLETFGVAFPKSQPMRVYGSLWNADDWATRGGLVKTNWSEAPFVASFRQFKADACVLFEGVSSCDGAASSTPDGQHYWLSQELDASDMKRLKKVQSKYMVYNYCTDVNRFPQGLPYECNAT